MTTKNSGGLQKPFLGFEGPNYTQVPDALFDELLAYLSGAEIKVLMYIIRRTFGFKRDSDTISLSQMLTGITTRDGKVLDHGTGLSKPSLLRALRSLQERQIIFTERQRSVERGDEPTVYRLNIRDETPGKKMSLPLVKKVGQGGGQEISPGPWSRNVTTQDTGLQETVEQETDSNISNIRKVQPAKGR
ncbi:MAG: replication protein, partial [Nitrospirota bacterium]